MLSGIEYIDRIVARFEYYLLLMLTLIVTVILVLQVILRYVFSNPLFWAEEVSTILLVFITFLGLSLLVYRRQLIYLDLLETRLQGPALSLVKWVVDVCLFVVLLTLVYSSTGWVLDSNTRTEFSSTLNLPRWISYMVIPVSMSAMGWHQFVHIVRRFSKEKW